LIPTKVIIGKISVGWEIKMKNSNMILYRLYKFYGEGTETTVDDDEHETPPPLPEKKPDEKKKEETPQFTQEQVNRFLADERRKAQKANQKTIDDLEKLRKNASLTEAEKASLEERIETIKNDFLTKEQIAQKEQQKAKQKQQEELESVKKDIDKWKKLYEDQNVENNLLGAAASDPDVFNPNQILELLKPKTRLVEELDTEGRPTGRLTPKIRLAGKNKDGEPIVLELSPAEAVKQLKENTTEYGNLFKSNVVRGVGGNNNGDTRRGNNPPDDPAAFRAWRKQNPDYLKAT
jgi:hypothetical protein